MPAHPNVLIIENEDVLRDALSDVIDLIGYASVGVGGGAEALEYLRSHPAPDLILLDLRMPGMDGWEFRRRQLADPSLAGIPVVTLSSFHADEQRREDLKADGYMTKVDIFRELPTMLAQYCRRVPQPSLA
jgi:CheY-like chemotaxis protein